MKAIASVLILFGSFLFGAVCQRGRRERIDCLSGLSKALSRVGAELSGKNAALPAIAERMAEKDGDAGAFFSALSQKLSALGERSFRELWNEAMDLTLSVLDPSEDSAMRELGAALGRYPLDMQLACLSRCRSLFEEDLALARRSLPNDMRLSWGLSLSSGLLLLIVFL